VVCVVLVLACRATGRDDLSPWWRVTISADERWVAWEGRGGTTRLTPLAGGSPRQFQADSLIWLPEGGRGLVLPWLDEEHPLTRRATLIDAATGRTREVPLAMALGLWDQPKLAVAPGGRRLAILRPSPFHQMESGPPKGQDDALVIQSLDGEVSGKYRGYRPVAPVWSPSGRKLFYIEANASEFDEGRPWCLDLVHGKQVRAEVGDSEADYNTYAAFRGWWLDEDTVLWSSRNGIWTAPWSTLKARCLEPGGPDAADVLSRDGVAWILVMTEGHFGAWRYARRPDGSWGRTGGEMARAELVPPFSFLPGSQPMLVGLSRRFPGQVFVLVGETIARDTVAGLGQRFGWSVEPMGPR